MGYIHISESNNQKDNLSVQKNRHKKSFRYTNRIRQIIRTKLQDNTKS